MTISSEFRHRKRGVEARVILASAAAQRDLNAMFYQRTSLVLACRAKLSDDHFKLALQPLVHCAAKGSLEPILHKFRSAASGCS